MVRFGVYELDLASGELRKGGLKIRLSGQPFQVLAILLERPGEVVTREELQKKLWREGTFVDFGHSLNTAINKIREALGDSAENPRFVETLARRGYRFIAPVDGVGADLPTHVAAERRETENPPPDLGGYARWPRRLSGWLVAGLLLVLLIGGTIWVWRPSPQGTYLLKLTRLTSDSGLTTDGVISPDGTLVAYASDRGGEENLDIWVKQVAGGEPIRLTRNSADDHFPDFSPDGSQLVFRSEQEGGGIYLVSTLGGEERLLVPHGRNPRFSPDGRWIAYWTGYHSVGLMGAQAGTDLFVIASTGGVPQGVLKGFAAPGCPVWSPDSSRLLFFGYAEGPSPFNQANSDWWVVSREGGVAVKTGSFDVLEKQQIARTFPPSQWIGNRILFHAQMGDSVNLWQVPISPHTFQVTGPARQLTSGSALEIRPSVARNGVLVFSSLLENGDIWSLPVDANQGKAIGKLEQVTQGGSAEVNPSISVDGKSLVFVSDRSGNPDIWMKDLESGREKALTVTPQHEISPGISSDGAWVTYFTRAGDIQVTATNGGLTKTVCEGCGGAWDWGPDNQSLIFNSGSIRGGQADLYLLHLSSGEKTLLVKHPASGIMQGKFSPDFHWITFVLAPQGCRVFIAPFRGESAIQEKEWFALSDGSSWDDKPRWSPDGNLLYFTSDRDGFVCLWAQRLDAVTKRPSGAPFAVYHLHQARRSMANVGYGPLEISVARDKIVFNMVELTGNIWMTKLDLN
jgi:Tol biopolymer transport system component/DNA-binding winged helix-turn-helix (wHTH) protein